MALYRSNSPFRLSTVAWDTYSPRRCQQSGRNSLRELNSDRDRGQRTAKAILPASENGISSQLSVRRPSTRSTYCRLYRQYDQSETTNYPFDTASADRATTDSSDRSPDPTGCRSPNDDPSETRTVRRCRGVRRCRTVRRCRGVRRCRTVRLSLRYVFPVVAFSD